MTIWYIQITSCCLGSTNTDGSIYTGKPVYKGHGREPENVPNFKQILFSWKKKKKKLIRHKL